MLLETAVGVHYSLHDEHGYANVEQVINRSSLLDYVKERRLNLINDGMDDETELDAATYLEENYHDITKAYVQCNTQTT